MKVEMIVNKTLCRDLWTSVRRCAVLASLAYLVHLVLTIAFSGAIMAASLFILAVAVGMFWLYDDRKGLVERVADEDRYEAQLARSLHRQGGHFDEEEAWRSSPDYRRQRLEGDRTTTDYPPAAERKE